MSGKASCKGAKRQDLFIKVTRQNPTLRRPRPPPGENIRNVPSALRRESHGHRKVFCRSRGADAEGDVMLRWRRHTALADRFADTLGFFSQVVMRSS